MRSVSLLALVLALAALLLAVPSISGLLLQAAWAQSKTNTPPLLSASTSTQTITQSTDTTILQLKMASGATKSPFKILNSNGEAVVEIFPDGTTRFGVSSVTIDAETNVLTAEEVNVGQKVRANVLEAIEDANIGRDTNVGRDANIGGTARAAALEASGDANVGGMMKTQVLEATGNSKIGGNSQVMGDETVEGNSMIKGNSDVTGDLTVSGGDIFLQSSSIEFGSGGSDPVILDDTSNPGKLTISDGVVIQSEGLSVTGETTAQAITAVSLATTGSADVGSNLSVNGYATVGGTLTFGSLPSESIGTGFLQNQAVTSAKLADGSVGTTKISGGAVGTTQLSDNAVLSGKILDGTIINADISPTAAIDLTKLGTGLLPPGIVVNSGNIADGSITNFDISPTAAIAYSKLTLTNSINSLDILDGTITGNDIAPNTITSNNIPNNAILGSDIISGAITSTHIGAGAVTSGHLAPGAMKIPVFLNSGEDRIGAAAAEEKILGLGYLALPGGGGNTGERIVVPISGKITSIYVFAPPADIDSTMEIVLFIDNLSGIGTGFSGNVCSFFGGHSCVNTSLDIAVNPGDTLQILVATEPDHVPSTVSVSLVISSP